MRLHSQQGQANLTAIAIVIGLVVTTVWVWKRLPLETQDLIIDQALPLAAVALLAVSLVVWIVKKVRRGRQVRKERDRLISAFQGATAQDKKLELSFALAEINGYRVQDLESIVPELKELWINTLQRALGEKQHRIRGMSASHLGILKDKTVVPLLIKALEDDHAYVRSCAALGLGRLRATEARERLLYLMEEDWDQTVRSRAKEAVERLRV